MVPGPSISDCLHLPNRTFELKAIEGYRCIFATFPTPLHTPLPIGWNLIRGSIAFQEQSYNVLSVYDLDSTQAGRHRS